MAALSSALTVSGDIQLTNKGVAYCERYSRPAIERRIERHLALVTALLAIIDQQDGDPDLEPIDELLEGDERDDMEPTLGWSEDESKVGEFFIREYQPDDAEAVNEDGGDINDEPQDDIWQDMEPPQPSLAHPNGAHLFGGGSGI